MLAMPDICVPSLTNEQAIKAKANAYACLKELSAINAFSCGECENPKFKIGDENDPDLGLLYDSDSPIAKTVGGRPFDRAYLFRRTPCTKTVMENAEIMAEAALSLCSDNNPKHTNTNEAVFTGFAINKTVYPLDSIVSYITTRSLYDSVAEENRAFYSTLKEQIATVNKMAFSPDYAHLSPKGRICTAIGKVFESGRPENDSEDADLCNDYLFGLISSIDEMFCDSYSVPKLKSIIIKDKKRDELKQKPSVLSKKSSKGKKKFKEDARLAGNLLKNYYFNGLEVLGSDDFDTKSLVSKQDAEHYIPTALLRCEDQAIPVSNALYRLSRLYLDIEEKIKSASALDKKTVQPDTDHSKDTDTDAFEQRAIPERFLLVDTDVTMSCVYDDGSETRLIKVLNDPENARVGGSILDNELFCYDMEQAYERIRTLFIGKSLEDVLPIVEGWLDKYLLFFKNLDAALESVSADVELAAINCTQSNIFVHYVGASVKRKEYLYGKYLAFLNESNTAKELERATKELLSNTSLEILSMDQDEQPQSLEDQIYGCLCKQMKRLSKVCVESEFYKNELDKNVLQVIFEQNGKNETDDFGFTVRKTFMSVGEPIRFTVPDTDRDFRIFKSMENSCFATMNPLAKDFIREKDQSCADKKPEDILCDLMYKEGAYLADVRFNNAIPKNEIHVIRSAKGIPPWFIDEINEQSYECDCYKAYQKALALEEQHCTKLWNPHLVLSASNLPSVCKKSAEN